MKSNQLKQLLRHIILEVNSQFSESHDYDNFDDPSNVANAIYQGLYKAPDFMGEDEQGRKVWSFTLHSNTGPRHLIMRDKDGEWFYSDSDGHGRKWVYAGNHIAVKKKDREEYKTTGKLANEMIANKNVEPDFFGAVNVENVQNDYQKLQKQGINSDLHSGRCPVCGKGGYKHKKGSNLNYCSNGHAWNDNGSILINTDNGNIEEETGTGAVAGYSTPFAFKPTHKKKKKKKHEQIGESHFLDKVKQKISAPQLSLEKILPDGRYGDDMEDGRRSNRVAGIKEMEKPTVREISGTRYFAEVPVGAEFKIPGQPMTFRKVNENIAVLGRKKVKIKNDTLVNIHGDIKEMTTSSAAGGQPGGTIQTPAWGTKNKLGSPKGIQGSEKLGYKVVRSITNEGK